jgi:hypothetical protein
MRPHTITHWVRRTVSILEKVTALVVMLAVVRFGLNSASVMAVLDWSDIATIYAVIERVLLAVIGLELARMLLTHSITAVLELIAFVIARKILKPDLESIDIFLSVIAFVALLGARHYFVREQSERTLGGD